METGQCCRTCHYWGSRIGQLELMASRCLWEPKEHLPSSVIITIKPLMGFTKPSDGQNCKCWKERLGNV